MISADTALSNYSKGETVVLDGDIKELFSNLPANYVNVRVKHGSKMRNVLGFALNAFKDDENRRMVIGGSGDAMYKAISCAEIVKRKLKGLHQITKISYLRLDEYWEPKNSELDRLKVTREIPQIHILLSKDILNADEPGYQPPGGIDPMLRNEQERPKKYRKCYRVQRHNSNRDTGQVVFQRDVKRKSKSESSDHLDEKK